MGTVSAATGALAGLAAGATIVGPVAAVVGGLVGSVMGAAAGGILDEQHGRAAVGDSEARPEDIDAGESLSTVIPTKTKNTPEAPEPKKANAVIRPR